MFLRKQNAHGKIEQNFSSFMLIAGDNETGLSLSLVSWSLSAFSRSSLGIFMV
jgi:hypothetical protein